VDVSNVPRGAACNCICPSCKAPLIAKQGKLKEWHFAHGVKHAGRGVEELCEYSFEVSVRLMLLQLAEDRLKIRMPKLAITGKVRSPQTRKEKVIELLVADQTLIDLNEPELNAHYSGATVDILGRIGQYQIAVYLSHKGRPVPDTIRNPENKQSGCIALYLDNLQQYLYQEKKGRYSHALLKFVEDHSTDRSWLFHPREDSSRDTVNQQLDYWLKQQEREYHQGQEPTQYRCAMCKSKWSGYSRECESCGTHLYTSVVK